MKNIFLILSGLTVIAFSFVACEKNADVELPVVSPQLVVNCFLSPQDTLIKVRVTKSKPLFQTGSVNVQDPVTDATVRLSGNSTSVLLSYDAALGQYTIPASAFPILTGIEYAIEVSAPQLETVNSKTTIPDAVPADFTASMTYTLDTSDMYNWQYSIHSSTSFTDYPQEGNLYRITNRGLVYQSFQQDTVSWVLSDLIFADGDQNGEQISNTIDQIIGVPSPALTGDSAMAVNIVFVHCSKEYYYYHQSLLNYNGGGDPFSEPTLVYSNIENGYGVFAGCAYAIRRINL